MQVGAAGQEKRGWGLHGGVPDKFPIGVVGTGGEAWEEDCAGGKTTPSQVAGGGSGL